MPLSTNLPTDKVDGDASHTSGHNTTNTRVNAIATEVNAHEAATTSVHGITDTSALVTTSSISELVDDRVNALIVEGSGITKTYNDGAGTLTLASTGGASAWQFPVGDYGAVGDGKVIRDVATTNGSGVITSATGGFVVGDVGKHIMISGAIGVANIPLITTIASYQSATQVTLTATATQTATGLPAVWGTDDTSAIRDALDAAGTYARAHNFYAEVLFDASIYVLSAAPIQTASPYFNTQLPIPVPTDNTDRKLEIALVGAGTNSHFQFWASTVPTLLGTCLVSMQTAPSSIDGTYGVQSVIGAPTGYAGFSGNFVNVKPVVRDLAVVCPAYTNLTAIDTTWAGGLRLDGAGSHIFAQPLEGSGTLQRDLIDDSVFQSRLGCGLRTPCVGNNADVTIPDFVSEGYTVGLRVAGEHVLIGNLKTIYNNIALIIDDAVGLSSNGHGLIIDRWTPEAYNGGISVTGGGNTFIDINMSTEFSATAYDVSDSSNVLKGEFRFYSTDSRDIVITGADNLRVLDLRNTPGNVTAPSVPATTVAHQNVFWRDAAVNIAGGTVTVIAVDGVTTGLTAGTVIVPSGKTITLTYSGSPTWVWTLL